jgi:hypothetical protein
MNFLFSINQRGSEMANERIKLEMTTMDMLTAMSDGNPGAITVLMFLLRDGGKIDTDDAFGGLGSILTMDSLGIYGPSIWMLFKDVCGQSLMKMIAMLRAYQMGQLAGVTKEALMYGIDNRGNGLDVNAAVEAIKEALPGFNTELVA